MPLSAVLVSSVLTESLLSLRRVQASSFTAVNSLHSGNAGNHPHVTRGLAWSTVFQHLYKGCRRPPLLFFSFLFSYLPFRGVLSSGVKGTSARPLIARRGTAAYFVCLRALIRSNFCLLPFIDNSGGVGTSRKGQTVFMTWGSSICRR